MHSDNGLYFTSTFSFHLAHHSVHPTSVDASGVIIVQYIEFPHLLHPHNGHKGPHLFGTVNYSVSMDPCNQHPSARLLVNMLLNSSC